MPFNDATKRLQAIFNFVDEFGIGELALRSQFDQAFLDIIGGINTLADYQESLFATSDFSDLRYLGRYDTPPTTRTDGSVLLAGDFYNSLTVTRPNLFYVYDGTAFQLATDFPTLGTFFKSMAGAETAAVARGLLGLGTAAQQNVSAFVASGGAAVTQVLLATGGYALVLTDWNQAHLTGPGCGFLAGSAAATNGPAAVNLVAIYSAYDANAGMLMAFAPASNARYLRFRTAGTWGSWILDGAPLLVSDFAAAAIRVAAEGYTTPLETELATAAWAAGYADAAIAALGAPTTLLGTITTTSGNSQSLTGLTMTGYKFLRIVFVGVSTNGASGFLQVAGQTVYTVTAGSGTVRGMVDIDLTDGTFRANLADAGVSDSALSSAYCGDTSIVNASTSIAIVCSVGNFDAGSVRVYGIK